MFHAPRILFASLAAAICFWIVWHYYPVRHEQGLVIPVLVAVVFGGLLCLTGTVMSARQPQRQWIYLNWATVGGLFAVMCIGILHIAPFVFLALICAFVPAVLKARENRSNGLVSFFLTGAFALVMFTVLLFFVVRIGVEMVNPPAGSRVMTSLPEVDYVDAFQIEVPIDVPFDIDTLIILTKFSLSPPHAEAPDLRAWRGRSLEAGSKIGHWSVYYKDSCEAHIGFQRSFIDFKVSVFHQKKAETSLISLITVAQFKNIWGTLYFIPVRFGHQIYLADTARKLKTQLLKIR